MNSPVEASSAPAVDASTAAPKARQSKIDQLRAEFEVASEHLNQCRLDEAGAIGEDAKREARLARVQAKIDFDKAKAALGAAEKKTSERRTADKNRKRQARADQKREKDLAEKAEKDAYANARRDAEEENRLRDATAKQAAQINARAQQQQQGDAMLAGARELLRSRFIYGAGREQWFDRQTRSWRGPRAFDQIIGDQMPEGDRGRLLVPSTVWREMPDKPEVENERFIPGDDRLIAEELGKQWVNSWRAPTIKPAPGNPRAVALIRKHILHLTNGNRRNAAHLLDWLAHGVQRPGKKINWGPMLVGPQGCGKDTLFEIMQRVYDGEDRDDGGNARIVENLELAKGRNVFVSCSQFVYVPEIKSDDRNGLGNILKTLITGKAATVDEKFVASFKAPNRANIMAAANLLSSVPVESGDRRFFVLIVDRKPGPEYFRVLREAFLSDTGAAAWAHYLMSRDLSGFNAGGEAPESGHKSAAIAATANRGIQWLTQRFEEGLPPFHHDVISLAEAHEVIAGIKGAPINQIGMSTLTAFLKDKGGKQPAGALRWTNLAGEKKQGRVWVIREADWYLQRPGKMALAMVGRFRFADDAGDDDAAPAEVIKPAAFDAKPSAAGEAWAADTVAENEVAVERLLHLLNGLRFSIGLAPLDSTMAPADPAALRTEIDALRTEINALGEAS
jgi:hypothetical protein